MKKAACFLKLRHSRYQSLLRAQQLAQVIGVSVKTVSKLVRDGKLACVQVTGRERRFTPEQVQEFIQGQSIPTRVYRRTSLRLSSPPKKGGAKSVGVSGTGLTK
jgi:excisionase family DNA binding protein